MRQPYDLDLVRFFDATGVFLFVTFHGLDGILYGLGILPLACLTSRQEDWRLGCPMVGLVYHWVSPAYGVMSDDLIYKSLAVASGVTI